MVTAAHCTYHASKDSLKVAVGFTDLGVVDKTRSFVLDVEKIINHPSYSEDSTINDISILGIHVDCNLAALYSDKRGHCSRYGIFREINFGVIFFVSFISSPVLIFHVLRKIMISCQNILHSTQSPVVYAFTSSRLL